MRRHTLPAALLFSFASLVLLVAGCGVEDALVGGRCAPGYVECGLQCVKGTSCASVEDAAGAEATDAPPEATVEGLQTDSALDEDTGAADGEGGAGPSPEAGPNDASGDSLPMTDGAGADAQRDADANAVQADAAASDGSADSTDAPAATDSADASVDAGATDSSDAGVVEAGDSSAVDSGFEDTASPDATANDGEAGNPCTSPLVYCGGLCIDVSADPLNCGACNVVCASQLCESSRCVGAAPGGIVYAGHDYTTTLPGTAQARVLSNAVFIPQTNPLQVMSYERYATASAIAHVNNILNGVAAQVGRTLNIVHTTSDNDIPTQLALPNYDVLLVHDQPMAPDGALGILGTSWASTLATFTLGGGIVVVLDGGTGIAQMPSFATGTTLLSVTANSLVAISTPLVVASRVDVVGIGVISPYGAGQSTVSIATEPDVGNVVYVVELSSDAGSGAPVVVHKAF